MDGRERLPVGFKPDNEYYIIAAQTFRIVASNCRHLLARDGQRRKSDWYLSGA